MRQSTVFVNDYLKKQRTGISFLDEDYERVETMWNKEDDRLLALQMLPAFHGYNTWGQCSTEHFRILLLYTAQMMSGLNQEDSSDPNHPVVASFHFLSLSLIRCIEVSTSSIVEILHINIISRDDIVFDYSAVMDLSFALPAPLDEDSLFKIVVDNS